MHSQLGGLKLLIYFFYIFLNFILIMEPKIKNQFIKNLMIVYKVFILKLIIKQSSLFSPKKSLYHF